jgi:two-component system sensor histidine kinase TctE
VVTLRARADAAGYQLQVEDDGPGVSVDVMARLGERFIKGRDSRGSGLGMAIARSVMEGHGGHLAVERAHPEGGARVTLWWPR